MKAGAVFVDFTAVYDTKPRGVICKLLLDKNMILMILELVHNRSFALITGPGKQSRLRRLKNGASQESVLFNIYTHDQSATTAKKFAYADDLAILYSANNWKAFGKTLTQDMTTLSSYL